ncbi:MAG TPA: hypothetical protein VL087_02650 [Nitrospirota bacterium]|nr:hypothetical protein [Nitrospirota bacterium]
MHRQSRMVPFVFGLALGVLCTIFLPKYVRPYLPESVMGKETIVKGTVMAKEKKGNALLLAVNTSQGALLATFTKKGDEVNLLINEKDGVEFTLEKYKPFIDDPNITRVVKSEQISSPESEKASVAPAKSAGKITKEFKPRTQGKLSPPAAASKETPGVQQQSRESVPPPPGNKVGEP